MFFRFIRNFSKRITQVWQRWINRDLLSLLSTVRLGGLIVAALALWGFAQIADEVLEKETQSFDTSILLALRQIHTPVLNQIMLGLTFLGEPSVLVVMSLGLGVGLLLWRRQAEATTLAIAAGGAAGLNFLLKDLFARARPALWTRMVDVRYYSFPSGHATMSMVIYGLIGYLLATHFGRWRGLIVSVTLLLITGIGFSRLYLGVHWPTDVIAGYASGLVWLIACILSLEIARGRGFRRSPKHPLSSSQSEQVQSKQVNEPTERSSQK